jgi:hypothetical protein
MNEMAKISSYGISWQGDEEDTPRIDGAHGQSVTDVSPQRGMIIREERCSVETLDLDRNEVISSIGGDRSPGGTIDVEIPPTVRDRVRIVRDRPAVLDQTALHHIMKRVVGGHRRLTSSQVVPG